MVSLRFFFTSRTERPCLDKELPEERVRDALVQVADVARRICAANSIEETSSDQPLMQLIRSAAKARIQRIARRAPPSSPARARAPPPAAPPVLERVSFVARGTAGKNIASATMRRRRARAPPRVRLRARRRIQRCERRRAPTAPRPPSRRASRALPPRAEENRKRTLIPFAFQRHVEK